MTHQLIAAKTCPKCDSSDYTFRAPKMIDPDPDQEHGPVETKYLCKACGYEWKVKVPIR